MKKQFAIISLLMLLFIITGPGCSSLPKQVEPRSAMFAQVKMKAAREAQQRQAYQRAMQLYAEAYRHFTYIDDLEGKIHASLAIARQHFYLDNQDETGHWLARATRSIEAGAPELVGAKTLLQVEMAFARKDYKKVILLTANATTPNFNIEWHMELLCYTMVSKARLQQDHQIEFQQLMEKLPQLEKRFQKQKLADMEVLSLCYYYTGYINTLRKQWQQALQYFEKARRIDGLLDNAYGVGKALYAGGRCYEKLGLKEKAHSNYERALEIFTLLKDNVMLRKARKKIERFVPDSDAAR